MCISNIKSPYFDKTYCVNNPQIWPIYVPMWCYYLRKIDLVYDGADSITLSRFNEVLYKLRYYSIYECPLAVYSGRDLAYSFSEMADAKDDLQIDEQNLTAKEHFVFTDPLGQLYHFSVEGNAIRDGTKLPAEASLSKL